jgi:hypothetical protein
LHPQGALEPAPLHERPVAEQLRGRTVRRHAPAVEDDGPRAHVQHQVEIVGGDDLRVLEGPQLAEELPAGAVWRYEPKFDGFRCLAFRAGDAVELRSKSGQALGRYFPDIVAALAGVPAPFFALDGELLIPEGAGSSFEALQMRLHPAASRVAKLAQETPSAFVAFDALAARFTEVRFARDPRCPACAPGASPELVDLAPSCASEGVAGPKRAC